MTWATRMAGTPRSMPAGRSARTAAPITTVGSTNAAVSSDARQPPSGEPVAGQDVGRGEPDDDRQGRADGGLPEREPGDVPCDGAAERVADGVRRQTPGQQRDERPDVEDEQEHDRPGGQPGHERRGSRFGAVPSASAQDGVGPLGDPRLPVGADRGRVERGRLGGERGVVREHRGQRHVGVGRVHEEVQRQLGLERRREQEVDELLGLVGVVGAAQDAGELDLAEARRVDDGRRGGVDRRVGEDDLDGWAGAVADDERLRAVAGAGEPLVVRLGPPVDDLDAVVAQAASSSPASRPRRTRRSSPCTNASPGDDVAGFCDDEQVGVGGVGQRLEVGRRVQVVLGRTRPCRS